MPWRSLAWERGGPSHAESKDRAEFLGRGTGPGSPSQLQGFSTDSAIWGEQPRAFRPPAIFCGLGLGGTHEDTGTPLKGGADSVLAFPGTEPRRSGTATSWPGGKSCFLARKPPPEEQGWGAGGFPQATAPFLLQKQGRKRAFSQAAKTPAPVPPAPPEAAWRHGVPAGMRPGKPSDAQATAASPLRGRKSPCRAALG